MNGIVVAGFVALSVSSALAVDVTTCALPTLDDTVQTVPPGETAVLQADLSGCWYAVSLEEGATLQMNSHTISDCGAIAVECRGRRCTIEGPGEITGGMCNIVPYTIGPRRRPLMTVRNLYMHDTQGGIGGVVTLRAENLTVTRQLDDPNASGSQVAVTAHRIIGTNLSLTDNVGFGLTSYRPPLLTNSTLTGNNGFESGYDFMSNRRPRFANVTCGRSLNAASGSWGVCASD